MRRPSCIRSTIARLFNSLDHVTNGRMAYNVIASSRGADAANYGFDELMEHGLRYDRMEEFIDVCRALWNSVEPDAFTWDRETGVGGRRSVQGPRRSITPASSSRSAARSIACRRRKIAPVLIQAGSSPRGIKASAYISGPHLRAVAVEGGQGQAPRRARQGDRGSAAAIRRRSASCGAAG